jgi:predicted nucleotidyltransferase
MARTDSGTAYAQRVAALSPQEHDCLTRYCGVLERELGEQLVEVRMFGSAARGDMWPPHSPMHSDIDLLVVTRDAVPEGERMRLLDETYPLYLECGRQLSPHFFDEQRLTAPEDERTRVFLERIAPEAVVVYA